MAKDNGGPAFGGEIDDVFIDTSHPNTAPLKLQRRVAGMSLRDYFAAHAPHAPITDYFTDEAAQVIAVASYRYADAMLAERKK